MYVPYDAERGIHPQDQDFLAHERWDFEQTPPDHYPLMLHYPYVQLYRRQVIKQSDLVLAMHKRGDAFTAEQKARNFAYYEALTVRDSSLSACTQAVMAAEVGQVELAYDYLAEAALMDLDDLEHNTRDGLHIASLAGAWIGIVAGLGGMRDHSARLSFMPRLPEALTRIAFRLIFRGRRLAVEVRPEEATYRLLQGEPLEIAHYEEVETVGDEGPLVRAIPPAPARPAPEQPAGRAPARRRPPR
jgi:alpha,alpha-trehalose phosphorylase